MKRDEPRRRRREERTWLMRSEMRGEIKRLWDRGESREGTSLDLQASGCVFSLSVPVCVSAAGGEEQKDVYDVCIRVVFTIPSGTNMRHTHTSSSSASAS
jgi:hypothetical protein